MVDQVLTVSRYWVLQNWLLKYFWGINLLVVTLESTGTSTELKKRNIWKYFRFVLLSEIVTKLTNLSTSYFAFYVKTFKYIFSELYHVKKNQLFRYNTYSSANSKYNTYVVLSRYYIVYNFQNAFNYHFCQNSFSKQLTVNQTLFETIESNMFAFVTKDFLSI